MGVGCQRARRVTGFQRKAGEALSVGLEHLVRDWESTPRCLVTGARRGDHRVH